MWQCDMVRGGGGHDGIYGQSVSILLTFRAWSITVYTFAVHRNLVSSTLLHTGSL